MATLVVMEPGAVVRRRGKTIVVEKEGAQLAEVELHRLETVLLYGNVQVTTQAMHGLLNGGVEMALLSGDGRLLGQLTPPMPKNAALRRAQYETFSAPEKCLALARSLVAAKIRNSLETLKRADWDRGQALCAGARQALEECLAHARGAAALDVLCGIEGTAARHYFEGFATLLRSEELRYEGRSRRPPRDPVNAMLSFGYVLLVSQIQAQLDAAGWDPFFGFFHQQAYGRPSLALDLLEPLRAPVVDRLVVRLVNLKSLTAGDFHQSDTEGVRMTAAGLKTFLGTWAQWMEKQQVRETIRKGAEELGRCASKEIEPNAVEFFNWRA